MYIQLYIYMYTDTNIDLDLCLSVYLRLDQLDRPVEGPTGEDPDLGHDGYPVPEAPNKNGWLMG